MRAELAERLRVGRYVDAVLLGQGGMGAVYRARDPELERPVAIKVMLDASPDFVARFRREAQAIARLTHPHIVQVYDFGVDEEGNPYFVLELIDGTPLDELSRQRGALPPSEAIALIRQAAEGLAAAHQAGIVHRDVKPSNLIVDARGWVKLVDFGIARVSGGGAQALTGAAALLGTPGYMAPEQAQGKPVDARADIYALGLTLFELLAGRPPYEAADAISLVVKNLQEPLPDLRAGGLGLPEELVRLVEQMSAKEPDARLQSCVAVMAALDGLAAQASARLSSSQPARTVPPTHVHADRALLAAQAVGSQAVGSQAVGSQAVGSQAVDSQVVGSQPVGSEPVGSQAVDSHAGTVPARPRSRVRVLVPVALGLLLALSASGALLRFLRTRAQQAVAPEEPKALQDPPLHLRPLVRPLPRPGAPVVAPAIVEHARPLPPLPAGPLRVAVLKFNNVGHEVVLESLSLGIGETVVTTLNGAVPGVTLLERTNLESEIEEIDRGGDLHFDKLSVAQLGQLKGVEYAVQGGFQRAGNRLRVTARFVRVADGEILDTVRVDGSMRLLFAVQDQVAKALREKLVALAAREARR